MEQKPTKGIAVDGSCLGNPGKGSYRAVDIETGKELFKIDFGLTTNNVMEFCGIVHSLKYNKENKLGLNVYSDSVVGIAWANSWEVNTSLKKNENEIHWKFINNCILWLANNTKQNNVQVYKWNTKDWGEIPADFGNKKPKIINNEMILKSELLNFIKEEENKEFADITTLARLKQRFKL